VNAPHPTALLNGTALPRPDGGDPDWAGVHPRQIDPEQRERFEAYLLEIFTALGMPPGTPGTEDTPRRFLRALVDATGGYEGDENLVTTFPTECRGEPGHRLSQIVEGPVPFYSLCEHHALPFHGTAYLGYIAQDRILGLSKLTRLVRLFAQRFTVQERLNEQIADALEQILAPHGVAVYIDAVHLCTRMRGVRELDSSTRTTTWRGAYAEDPGLRAEFFQHLQASGAGGHARY
jgi:GTP cyclohydrolase I